MAKTSEYPAARKAMLEDIKEGVFKPCYLICGEEAYLRKSNRDALEKALVTEDGGMNFKRFQDGDVSQEEIIDLAETLPFFADRRVILTQDSGLFQAGAGDLLADYMKEPSQTTVFIFSESRVDKRGKLYKAVRKIGRVLECEVPPQLKLREWVAGYLIRKDRQIAAATADHFLEKVGSDLMNIRNELDKLVSYTEGRREVTKSDVDTVCAGWLTGRIFEMTDAISEGNRKRAINLYYDLLALKEAPQRILFLITRQFNLMLQVKDMQLRRLPHGQIASATHLSPYIAGKYERWADGYDFETLKRMLTLCADSDEAVKTGKLDQTISVEMVIVSCTSALKKQA